MKINVLMSCMHQQDASIIQRSNVQTDVVVINQCDKDSEEEFDFYNKKGVKCHAKFVCTKERGLSRSRNMAIANAWGDICYLCDDDELLVDDFEQILINAYLNNPKASVIIFSLKRKGYQYPECEQNASLKLILRTSSVQTTFKLSKINMNNITFDTLMGSGTGNGGGEENKFLMDCKRKGLSIIYVPQVIGTVISENSQWFHGFTEKYFRDKAWGIRRVLGTPLAIVHLSYWLFFRSRYYNISYSKYKVFKCFFKGFFENRNS